MEDQSDFLQRLNKGKFLLHHSGWSDHPGWWSLLAALFLVLVLVSLMMFRSFKKEAFFSLPESYVWDNASFKRIEPPLSLPLYIKEIVPFSQQFRSYQALFSVFNQNFILVLPRPTDWDNKRIEKEIRSALALRQPEKKELILPDGTKAVELIYNPERFAVKELPSFGLNLLKEGENRFIFAVLDRQIIISNAPTLLLGLLLK